MKHLTIIATLIAVQWMGAKATMAMEGNYHFGYLGGIQLEEKTTIYAMGMVFRETPFADMRGAGIVNRKDVDNLKHFELDYDSKNRLVEVRYMLNDQLLPYADRFVRASKIIITYQDSLEIRTFFNEYGHRTLVAGNVYSTLIVKDAHNRRKSLTFLGLNDEPVANDFGIASYHWKVESANQIVESRFDLEGNLVRNRPEFQFMVTRFRFDDTGMLERMTHLGLDGQHITVDDAGAAHIEVKYDSLGRLVEWANYDTEDQLVKGMTGIAKIRYEPSPYTTEQKAFFFDEKNNPMSTPWGVHGVLYQFDAFGNVVDRRFVGEFNNPVDTKNGLGIEKTHYTPDGKHVQATAYYDKTEQPIGFGANRIHRILVECDAQSELIRTSFRNLEGELVNGWYGYAIEEKVFDEKGRMVALRYMDSEKEMVNNEELGVAEFRYDYNCSDALEGFEAYNQESVKVEPIWNPVH